MNDVKVISLGGSIISPGEVDTDFLKLFLSALTEYLEQELNRKLILVCGGGNTARTYQDAFRQIITEPGDDALDWIGIAATCLNAELLKQMFHTYCPEKVITDPTSVSLFPGRMLVASGWKPGFSTDYDAVLLAEKFQADTLINLSNIPRVYTDDPKKYSEAKPLDEISWNGFQKLIGSVWVPGTNSPFDPVATRYAAEIHLRVIVAAGREIENLKLLLNNKEFEGTVIGPD